MTIDLYTVTDGNVAVAADVNQLINALQGGGTIAVPWLFKTKTGNDFIVDLPDAAGARVFKVRNSSGTTVFSVDTLGNFTPTALVLPQSTTPTQTAEGSTAWDTDDDVLIIGSGAATLIFTPDPTSAAGGIKYASGAKTRVVLPIGTAGQVLTVNAGATAPSWSAANPFDGLQSQFRTGRRRLMEWTASRLTWTPTDAFYLVAGLGTWFASSTTASYAVTEAAEGSVLVTTGSATALASALGSVDNVSSPATRGIISPAKNPRMIVRWIPGASSASLASTYAGFVVGGGAIPSATMNGAYLRANTTGNLFFVTRQGGSETTTDLGVRPTVLTSYEIETVDAGVTWTCRNSTTGVVVATQTGNVPTAATQLAPIIGGNQTAACAHFTAAYLYVEGNFTP